MGKSDFHSVEKIRYINFLKYNIIDGIIHTMEFNLLNLWVNEHK